MHWRGRRADSICRESIQVMGRAHAPPLVEEVTVRPFATRRMSVFPLEPRG
jgi:hypothetical protein